ncbi:MAG TPA: DEAD/DEAH box helicase family protein [Candidatus Paceibacterota bacterium]|nr:DEAD/DEAH box helicase family protein [Candidatus Paceibacterota bacterium]
MKITPRPAQKLAIPAALKGLRSRSKRALVVLATGLGKTIAAAVIAKKFGAKRILFLVHSNFILSHAQKDFRQVFNEKTKSVVYNGMCKNGAHNAEIVFATWQTMGRNLKSWKHNHFDLVIVDEAHHTEAETYRPVVEYFTAPRLAITATPDRGDGGDIRSVFGPEVVNITLEEAIARGWLPRVEYHVIIDKSLNEEALQNIAREIREGKKRFTMAEVNRRLFIRKRDEEIAKIIEGYNEKSVVFCANIKHAERISSAMKLSAVFHSEAAHTQKATWEKNQKTLDMLRNGIVRRVCAVNAFNEGVDVPSVGLVAFCRVTGSDTIFRQQLGRGLRPGKDKLVVLDFVGNLERIQMVRRVMNRIADLHEYYTDENERQREGYERRSFEVSGSGFEFTFSDKVVDLMKVLEHCETDFYPTWQEASSICISKGIISWPQYSKRYKEDRRLPANPWQYYGGFPGYPVFFGRVPKLPKYGTWLEAAKVARRLKIRSEPEYQRRYKEDPRLPYDPNDKYDDFPGWPAFLDYRWTIEDFREAGNRWNQGKARKQD